MPDSFAAFRDRTACQPVYVILGVQGSGTNLLSRLLEQAFNKLTSTQNLLQKAEDFARVLSK